METGLVCGNCGHVDTTEKRAAGLCPECGSDQHWEYNAATKTLIAEVKSHARQHYDQNGWDFVIEAWDDEDIVYAMKGATTPAQAIRNVFEVVQDIDEARRESRGWAFS